MKHYIFYVIIMSYANVLPNEDRGLIVSVTLKSNKSGA